MEENNVMTSESLNRVSDQASEALSGATSNIKGASNIVIEKFRAYKGNLLELGIYLGIGFAVGFLLKKYFKYIFLLVLFIVSLVILEQFNLVHMSVEWAKVQKLFNLQQTGVAFDAQAVSSYTQWVKANFVAVLAASIGFLVGLKLG